MIDGQGASRDVGDKDEVGMSQPVGLAAGDWGSDTFSVCFWKELKERSSKR